MGKLCIVGSSNIDMVVNVSSFPRPGQTVMCKDVYTHMGGKGANQAVMARILGSEVVFISKVGADEYGRHIIKNLKKSTISAEYMLIDNNNPTGMAFAIINEDGENELLYIPGANMNFLPKNLLRIHELIKMADVVLCQLEIPVETVYEVMRVARRYNKRIVLNPAPGRILPKEILALCDILIPNETELEVISGVAKIKTITDIERAAKKIVKMGVKTVVVTLGERGALLFDGEKSVHIKGVKVKAVDTTGAGDAFIGSFTHFIGIGERYESAIMKANAIASVAVTRKGAQSSFPIRKEVLSIFNKDEYL